MKLKTILKCIERDNVTLIAWKLFYLWRDRQIDNPRTFGQTAITIQEIKDRMPGYIRRKDILLIRGALTSYGHLFPVNHYIIVKGKCVRVTPKAMGAWLTHGKVHDVINIAKNVRVKLPPQVLDVIKNALSRPKETHKITTRRWAKAHDKKTFFDGLPCRQDHIAKKRTLNASCTQCERERAYRGRR